MALNRLRNVTCIPAAIAATEGTARLYHVLSPVPCSSSLSLDFMRDAQALTSSVVPVFTLDRLLRDAGVSHVDLVKIDTESTEPQVLEGMRGVLERDHPFIVCEVLEGRGSERAVEQILGDLGYRFYLLTPDGPSIRGSVTGHRDWLNYLFTTLTPEDVALL